MVVMPAREPPGHLSEFQYHGFTRVRWSDERGSDGKGIPDLPAGIAGKELLER
jgi:hypothetical protein